ncbi:MAG: choice-of-anchor tandem repeat GloVer-containing protein [Rhizomicrobium sp.]
MHDFAGKPADGCTAEGSLIADRSGDLFGTTFEGGKHDYGTIFELPRRKNESLLYSFKGGRDGFYLEAGLIGDAQENLYGTTDYGGRMSACTNGGFGGCGTIFRLAPDGTKTVLYEFKGPPNDGFIPAGNLVLDESGYLYGTTERGGLSGCDGYESCGVVFKIAPDGTETVLHFFKGGKGDGENPVAGLIEDNAGNLYGTTEFGGARTPCNTGNGCGTVVEIGPDGSETILYNFSKKNGANGANPTAGLIADAAGNLYGTASQGGKYGYGTVYEITP